MSEEIFWREKFYPKDAPSKTLSDLRDHFSRFAESLQETLPDGRYKSLVLTKLEEAAMFATKAITHD